MTFRWNHCRKKSEYQNDKLMNTKVPLHFVIILLLIISIASTNIPLPEEAPRAPEVSWSIGFDEDLGKPMLTLKQDSTSRKVYLVAVAEEGDAMTADQGAFDADLYFDLYHDMWVFAECSWGVTVFHLWWEGEVVKITINGLSQMDFDPRERNPETLQRAGVVVASL